ncbi:unnamed protein product [Lactuca saligna]|uniref:Uncharacterized protein n=1 Tax=Lactuca saligna TaxID=75948 RepID=A0AA36EQ73_LACSI|nr:unnamed protein product [Lactuca saligna]
MTPHHHSPLADQSFASIADKFAQLVAITIANNNRLDSIIAKLTKITEILATMLIKSTIMEVITSQPLPPSPPTPLPTSPSQPLMLTMPTSPPLSLLTPLALPNPVEDTIVVAPSPKEPLLQPPLTTTYEHIRHLKLFFRLFDQ